MPSGCKGGCMPASYFLQPPRNSSTGKVPVLEYETFSRTVLRTFHACTRCCQNTPRQCFLFQDGDLTSWTGARWLQKAACWHAATFAATFPGTIQNGFCYHVAAAESRSGKIATGRVWRRIKLIREAPPPLIALPRELLSRQFRNRGLEPKSCERSAVCISQRRPTFDSTSPHPALQHTNSRFKFGWQR